MHVFPADAALVALAGSIAGDAMADAVDAAKLLDVDTPTVETGRCKRRAMAGPDRRWRRSRSTSFTISSVSRLGLW
jgi:hypothetical protein